MKKILSVLLVALLLVSVLGLPALVVSAADEMFAINSLAYSSTYSVLSYGTEYYTGLVKNASTNDSDYDLTITFTVKAAHAATSGNLIVPLDKVYDLSSSYSDSTAPYFKNFEYTIVADGVTTTKNATVMTDGKSGISGVNKYISIPLTSTEGSATNLNITLKGYFERAHATWVKKGTTFFDNFYTVVNGAQDSSKSAVLKSYYTYLAVASSRQHGAIKYSCIYKESTSAGYAGEKQQLRSDVNYCYDRGAGVYNQIQYDPVRASKGQSIVDVTIAFPAGVEVTKDTNATIAYTITGSLSTGYTITASLTKEQLESLSNSSYHSNFGRYNYLYNSFLDFTYFLKVPEEYTGDKVDITTSYKAYTVAGEETDSSNYSITVLEPVQDISDTALQNMIRDQNVINLDDSSAEACIFTNSTINNEAVLPIKGIAATWQNNMELPATVSRITNSFRTSAYISVTITNGTTDRAVTFIDVPNNKQISIGEGTDTDCGAGNNGTRYVHLNSGEWVLRVYSVPNFPDTGLGVHNIPGGAITGGFPILAYCVAPADGKNPKTGEKINDGDTSPVTMFFTYQAKYGANNSLEDKTNLGTIDEEDGSGTIILRENFVYRNQEAAYAGGVRVDNDTQKNFAQPNVGTTVSVPAKLNISGFNDVIEANANMYWHDPVMTFVLPKDVTLDTSIYTSAGTNKYTISDFTKTVQATVPEGGVLTLTKLSNIDDCEAWRITTPTGTKIKRQKGNVTANNALRIPVKFTVPSTVRGGAQNITMYLSSANGENFYIAPVSNYDANGYLSRPSVAEKITDTVDYDGDGSKTDSVGKVVMKAFDIHATFNLGCVNKHKDATTGNYVRSEEIDIPVAIGGTQSIRAECTNAGNIDMYNFKITDAYPNFGTGKSEYVEGTLVVQKVTATGTTTIPANLITQTGTAAAPVFTFDPSVILQPGEMLYVTREFKVRDDARPNMTVQATPSIYYTWPGGNSAETFPANYTTGESDSFEFRFFNTEIPEGKTAADVKTELLKTVVVQEGSTFKLNADMLSDTTKYPHGIPERDGYIFAGWVDGKADDTSVAVTAAGLEAGTVAKGSDLPTSFKTANDSITVTEDRDFYASWIKIGTVDREISDITIGCRNNSDETSVITEKSVDEFGFIGVNIRYVYNGNGKTGLRFLSRMSHSLKQEVLNLNSNGKVSYGHVVAQKAHVVGDLEDGKANVKKSPNVYTHYEGTNYDIFTTVINNIDVAHYSSDIAARPYIEYMDINGHDRTYYYQESESETVEGKAYYTNIKKLATFIDQVNQNGQTALPELVLKYVGYILNDQPINDDEFWYYFHKY